MLPLLGAVITTTGASPRLTVTVVAVPVPKMLVHATTIEFAPRLSAMLFVAVLVEELPLIVQVVPPGIVGPPLTVYETLMLELVVLVPLVGEVTMTLGVLPRVTVTDFVSVPNGLVHSTVIVLTPRLRPTLLVVALLLAEPLTVQLIPEVIVVEPSIV